MLLPAGYTPVEIELLAEIWQHSVPGTALVLAAWTSPRLPAERASLGHPDLAHHVVPPQPPSRGAVERLRADLQGAPAPHASRSPTRRRHPAVRHGGRRRVRAARRPCTRVSTTYDQTRGDRHGAQPHGVRGAARGGEHVRGDAHPVPALGRARRGQDGGGRVGVGQRLARRDDHLQPLRAERLRRPARRRPTAASRLAPPQWARARGRGGGAVDRVLRRVDHRLALGAGRGAAAADPRRGRRAAAARARVVRRGGQPRRRRGRPAGSWPPPRPTASCTSSGHMPPEVFTESLVTGQWPGLTLPALGPESYAVSLAAPAALVAGVPARPRGPAVGCSHATPPPAAGPSPPRAPGTTRPACSPPAAAGGSGPRVRQAARRTARSATRSGHEFLAWLRRPRPARPRGPPRRPREHRPRRACAPTACT